jgi:hypothetical protein
MAKWLEMRDLRYVVVIIIIIGDEVGHLGSMR